MMTYERSVTLAVALIFVAILASGLWSWAATDAASECLAQAHPALSVIAPVKRANDGTWWYIVHDPRGFDLEAAVVDYSPYCDVRLVDGRFSEYENAALEEAGRQQDW